jgi:hypothetical protein
MESEDPMKPAKLSLCNPRRFSSLHQNSISINSDKSRNLLSGSRKPDKEIFSADVQIETSAVRDANKLTLEMTWK